MFELAIGAAMGVGHHGSSTWGSHLDRQTVRYAARSAWHAVYGARLRGLRRELDYCEAQAGATSQAIQ
jgi:hypothetical protein